MSLKENIDAIKEEISAEEQFLESVIKAEGVLKKYRTPLIALAVVLIAGALGYATYDWMQARDLRISNEAYLKLQSHPDDQAALKTLKSKNPALYRAWEFHRAVKSDDIGRLSALSAQIKDPILKDLLTYQIDSLKRSDLERYTLEQDALLKEFALLQEAYLQLDQGKLKEAKETLAQISPDSPLQRLAQALEHYIKPERKR